MTALIDIMGVHQERRTRLSSVGYVCPADVRLKRYS